MPPLNKTTALGLVLSMPKNYPRGESRLPPTGPLPRPKNPAEAREILKAEAFPAPDVPSVTLRATEFTPLCPKTGQPDCGSVVIEYTPPKSCRESPALKFYLWSYRDDVSFCHA